MNSLGAEQMETGEVQALRLSDLLTYVRNTIKGAFHGSYWIIAEVTGLSVRRHYYFDLAEMQDGQVVAKVRGNLWEGVANRVIPRFTSATGQPPQVGMELMLLVQVDMHLQYGLSLTIYDINPDYTLGNLERKRKETIRQLQADGVMDLNKLMKLPPLLQRIAVISSETAAGWGDFQNQVYQSGLGSLFRIDLYPALMQGVNTTASVYQAMLKILARIEDYDALFILRGGGSKMDLAAFDDFELCSYIANFPIPVLTAIGHEQDTSIADMVAHTRLKTPTALAEFLVQRMLFQLNRVVAVEQKIERALVNRVGDLERQQSEVVSSLQYQLRKFERTETARLNDLSQSVIRRVNSAHTSSIRRTEYITLKIQTRLSELYLRVCHCLRDCERDHAGVLRSLKSDLYQWMLRTDHLRDRLVNDLRRLPMEQEQYLQHLSQLANSYDPHTIMQRGFVPVVKDATSVIHSHQLQPGDRVRLLLMDGEAEAAILDVQSQNTEQINE